MEKKEIMMSVKMEDASSLFSSCYSNSNNIPLWSVFDLCQETEEKGSLGFMDLLGVHQDYYNGGGGGGAPLLADNNSPSQVAGKDSTEATTVKECPSNSETQQQPTPTTPKSASPLSSSVSTTTTVDQAAPSSQHADKLSYYRCTSGSCNVKKRVERSFTDPTIVVTTYEGQHTHPSPLLMPRSSSSSSMPQTYFSHQHYLHPHHQQLLFNTFPSLDFPPPPPPSSSSQDTTNNNALFPLSDHGLLQDVLPSHMFKQE
ncbi:hypothetical protein Ahy_B06g080707 [Arachis hypogaea]|uniref:WRKY domain-containing protein n=1 Tax=Arachis hypogaea TaxID=3818 RepID=A0A444YIS2_ARAHY|nr:hypothetical protein Ahy_B06g080707 [Arachis hypogaea]